MRLFFVVIFLLLIPFFILYYQFKNPLVSEKLQEENLKGRVKIITSNNFENASAKPLEYYDIDGNLKFYSNVSISMSVSLPKKNEVTQQSNNRKLTINNFLVVETTLDSINKNYLNSKLSQIENYTHLTTRINLRNSDETFDDFKNINETKNLEIWIRDGNGEKIQKRIYNENGELQGYPESYCLRKEQNKILTENCDKINRSYIGDTLSISLLNKKKENIEKNFYYTSNKTKRIKRIYKENVLLKEEIYDADGSKWNFSNYLNDKFGNKISEDRFSDASKTKYKDLFEDNSASTTETHKRFNYTYDNQNNWVEFSGTENDKELFRVTREIEYYSFWEFLKNYFK